jgi:hypothetical protein
LEVNHDDALGFSPTRAAADGSRRRCTGGLERLKLEHRAEREAEHPDAADTQDITPAGAEVSVAQILGFRTDDSEHFKVLV